MNLCLFASDLHGKISRYEALFKAIKKEKPDYVFLGGDLLPHRKFEAKRSEIDEDNFVQDFLIRKFKGLKEKMDCMYPDVFIIPGNDDQKVIFDQTLEGEKDGLWRNIHNQFVEIGKYRFYGYGCVPPTPFRIKDWERFDISKEISQGCIAPTSGYHSTTINQDDQNTTIQDDLKALFKEDDLGFGVFLFHSPPYNTGLDLAQTVSGNPNLEAVIHVGSKAIRQLIDEKQPCITLHGHIHESARLTGEWKQLLGRTCSFSAAHDGPELALVSFDLRNPHAAKRRLIKT